MAPTAPLAALPSVLPLLSVLAAPSVPVSCSAWLSIIC
jgi:hypothetical protein